MPSHVILGYLDTLVAALGTLLLVVAGAALTLGLFLVRCGR